MAEYANGDKKVARQLEKRAITALSQTGMSQRQIGLIFGKSGTAIYQLLRRAREGKEAIAEYSSNRNAILEILEMDINAEIGRRDKCKEPLSSLVTAARYISELRRLEAGQSTANIDFIGQLEIRDRQEKARIKELEEILVTRDVDVASLPEPTLAALPEPPTNE